MSNLPPSNFERSSGSIGFMARFRNLSFRGRFFTISLLVHLVIVMLGGTVVLVRTIAPPDDFRGGVEGSGENPLVQAPPEDTPPEQTLSEATALPTATVAPVSAIISTNITQASFKVSTTAMPVAKIGAGDVGNLSKEFAKAALIGADGKIGGTNGFFGRREKAPNALVGTFYDLKQDKNRKPTGVSPEEYGKVFREFVREGWKESTLNKYFRSPNRLYATQIFIPDMPADAGPKAFDMDKEVQPSRWLVHYKGRVSPPQDGTYHFVGGGDDVLIVRFNGKVVLDRCWQQSSSDWKADRNYDYGFSGIANGFARGDALKVRANEFYDIEILIGEQPGGRAYFSLLMEQEGAEYKHDSRGNPILPIFRVADLAVAEPEKGQKFPPYEPNGPVWRASTVGGSTFDEFFSRR